MKILINEYGEALEVINFTDDDIEKSNNGLATLIDTDVSRYHINDSTKSGKFTPIGKRDH